MVVLALAEVVVVLPLVLVHSVVDMENPSVLVARIVAFHLVVVVVVSAAAFQSVDQLAGL